MGEVSCPGAENFSLTRGGPFHRLLARLGRAGDERSRVIERAVGGVLLTWLPLLVLSLAEGVAFGSRVDLPFLRDISANVRFLVALPILILAESRIDQRWRQLAREFLRRRLVGLAELPAFETAIESVTRWRDRLLPEAALAVVALIPSLFVARLEILTTSNWHSLGTSGSEVSLAGWWFNLVSAPFFRFLLLRWGWRMLMWTSFMWRVSRLDLHLSATHTDMAAGLGFLSEGQRVFGPIVFAGGTVIAGQVGNAIAYEGATLSSVQYHMIAYGILAILVLVVPLLVVAPRLIEVKKKALLDFGALVTEHAQLFDAKWSRADPPSGEVILGNPDASSLADLGGSFAVVRAMRVVPLDQATLITLAIAAVLPMLPVVGTRHAS